MWLICKKCNGGNAKHNQDPISWFRSNPLYGKRFLRAISPIKTDGILLKTKSGKGLAEAAKEWFWVTHLKRVIRDRLTNSIFYQLIGGLKLQLGSFMIDTSIKNKLQQIENKMIEA